MQKQLVAELKEIKSILAKIVGIEDSNEPEFSEEALNKAAKDFQKLCLERGDWVSDNDIRKYLPNADWRAGAFIRTEFKFNNYIKKGRQYYYSKKHLTALGKELKKRNVDLGRYMELLNDEATFQKSLLALSKNKKQAGSKKTYQIPSDLKDIQTSDIPAPPVELVKQDIANLKKEFYENKYSEYIDIYRNSHAMMKHIYWYQKYLEPGLKNRCKKWCENFNYANEALKRMKVKTETFVPVEEKDMIQL